VTALLGKPRALLALMALASFAAVAAALVSQHRFDMQPCAFCILQRLIFIAIGTVALAGALVPARAARIGAALLADLLATAGIAAALWQHFVAAKSTSCKLTLADRIVTGSGLDARWPEVFEVLASCADAAVNLLGVPYEFWSLALFALLMGAAVAVLISTLRRR
jgi:protein dithiol:quinone oxidoreductase